MNKLTVSRISLSILRRGLSAQPPVPASSEPGTEGRKDNLAPLYRPTELQKFLLVWTKKYKSKEDIPKFVSPELIDRTRSEARIKISNILMILTVLACVGSIIAGKAAAKRGESIYKINEDFHKQYNENYEKQEAAKTMK